MSAPAVDESLLLLLRAVFGETTQRWTAFHTWAETFDVGAEVDHGAYALLPAVDLRLLRGTRAQSCDPQGGHQRTVNRVRGIGRRTWTANQRILPPLTHLLGALDRTRVDAAVLPGPLTAAGILGVSAAEIGTVTVLVSPGEAQRAASVLVAAGAGFAGDPSLLQAKDPGDLAPFVASLDGASVQLLWWHSALGGVRPAIGPVPFRLGPLEARTCSPADRLWIDVERALSAHSGGERGHALLDLMSFASSEADVSLPGHVSAAFAVAACEAGAADDTAGLLQQLADCAEGRGRNVLMHLADAVSREHGMHCAAAKAALVAHAAEAEAARLGEAAGSTVRSASTARRVGIPQRLVSGTRGRAHRGRRLVSDFRRDARLAGTRPTGRSFLHFLRRRWQVTSRRALIVRLIERVLL